jgi:hypothetical protein
LLFRILENIISYICVLDDWEIEKDNITILDKKLGGGYFGVVKKGLYKEKENDSVVVAVKMLKGVFLCCLKTQKGEVIKM